ncbi:hypothetical protein AVEN_164759-1 [Araneus ventricosus]|uniref:Tc1-like transposase DDE domain-containing protein n=1 Tax=Araneus ventricosus TaxID=182803 RepID=A0A4Y2DQX2_ARAVE|nr:hypothetical protein AVEN_164759-1 [Araneus ventricosus]
MSFNVSDIPEFEIPLSEQPVLLLTDAMGSEFLFLDDKIHEGPHRATIEDEGLAKEDIIRLEWLAFSPYLRSLEHVWDILGRRVTERHPASRSIPELRIALIQE